MLLLGFIVLRSMKLKYLHLKCKSAAISRIRIWDYFKLSHLRSLFKLFCIFRISRSVIREFFFAI